MSTKINFEHEAQQKEETYKAGDFFINGCDLYQLAQVDAAKVNLICVTDGNRKTKSLEVGGAYNVSKSEIDTLFKNGDWQRVSVEITTKPYKG